MVRLLVCILALAAGAPSTARAAWRLDFGTEESPVAPGYLRVTKDTEYAPERGFGWLRPAQEPPAAPVRPGSNPGRLPGLFDRDRGTGSELHRDLVMAVREYHPLVAHTLRVDVPNGAYEVAVLSGDESFPSGELTVSARGGASRTAPAKPPGEHPITACRAVVADGHLDLTFDAPAYWVVNAVLICPPAEAQRVRRKETLFFRTIATEAEARAERRRLEALPLAALRRRARPYLAGICDWILERDLGSHALKGVNDTRESIFVNGNFARVLIAGTRITGKRRYLDEALRWCDTLVAQQNCVVTSKGSPGGWWSDVGPNHNIYFGDTGTAVSPLVLALGYATGERRARYLDALTRYAAFVREGSQVDLQGLGRQASTGWVLAAGPDAGALGCGYYGGHLSTAPYTIATATTGCLAMSQLYAATGRETYRDIARGAARWLLGIITQDGRIPYILDGTRQENEWSWSNVTYCGEGLIAAHLLAADRQLRGEVAAGLKRVVDRALREQTESGTWGEPRSEVGQRSGLVPQLLWWYYRAVEKRPEIEQALRRNYAYLLVPASSRRYGVKELVRPTGFAGLAAADFIRPDVTLK